MNATRFDTMSKLFATRRLNRRQAVTASAAVAAGVLAASQAVAQDATPEASPVVAGGDVEKTMYLFVQSFQSGSIVPTEGQEGRYTVTLEQGLGQTIYFADRPSRDVGVSPTAQFLEGLGFPDDNPPNAALLLETASGETDIAVVELFNPTYDEATHTATYEVAVLESWEDSVELGFSEAPADLATLAPEFGAAHLFIDDCPNGTVSCNSQDAPGSAGEFDNQAFCYNYLICMPCEPYGNSQPDKCSTTQHWNDRCNNEIDGCQYGAGCYAWWPGMELVCGN